MSAISLHSFIALAGRLKRLWFAGVKQFRGLRKRHPAPPQSGKSSHRHRAFFELP